MALIAGLCNEVTKGVFRMLHLVKSLAFSLIVSAGLLGPSVKVGERAPLFSLPASDGRTVSLKDYAGKKLVLVFYRGYW